MWRVLLVVLRFVAMDPVHHYAAPAGVIISAIERWKSRSYTLYHTGLGDRDLYDGICPKLCTFSERASEAEAVV